MFCRDGPLVQVVDERLLDHVRREAAKKTCLRVASLDVRSDRLLRRLAARPVVARFRIHGVDGRLFELLSFRALLSESLLNQPITFFKLSRDFIVCGQGSVEPGLREDFANGGTVQWLGLQQASDEVLYLAAEVAGAIVLVVVVPEELGVAELNGVKKPIFRGVGLGEWKARGNHDEENHADGEQVDRRTAVTLRTGHDLRCHVTPRANLAPEKA